MWIVLTVLLVIIVIATYAKIVSLIDERRYKKEYAYIFDAHKGIGYPLLTDIQQYEILDNENTECISKLTKYSFVPTGLLNFYLNISPKQYFIHLKTLNLNEILKFESGNLKDGFFINQTANGYEYLFVERQVVVYRKKFSSYDNLLSYMVYDRLNLYASKKYKYAWRKRYYHKLMA